MKVLGLGRSRTGTASLRCARLELGMEADYGCGDSGRYYSYGRMIADEGAGLRWWKNPPGELAVMVWVYKVLTRS